MTQTRFGDEACRKALSRLDSYIDNELRTESNLELMDHFQRCTGCTREAEERRNVRERLRTAVREVKVSAGLEGRVRDRLRQTREVPVKKLHLMAIAAAVVVCFGSWLGFQHTRLSGVLRVGLEDHVHCAVIRKGWAQAQGKVENLPARFQALIPIVREHVTQDLPLALAHECRYQGRQFVHLTFRNDRSLVSLVIARKQDGETLGTGMHTAGGSGFQVAAFESRDFLVFTVSDLPPQNNLDVLMALAPAVQNFLNHMGA